MDCCFPLSYFSYEDSFKRWEDYVYLVGSWDEQGNPFTEWSCPFWLNTFRDSTLTPDDVAFPSWADSSVRESFTSLSCTDSLYLFSAGTYEISEVVECNNRHPWVYSQVKETWSLTESCVYVLSCIQLFGTTWTAACQAPLSVGFFKNPVMGCHFLLQGIFPIQGSNPGLWHWRQILYHWATREAFVVRELQTETTIIHIY